jgi:hypothetical protein
MIRLAKYTPNIYYERSRDFQFIGRLYDVVLNSVKTNADIIHYGLPFSDQSPQELLELMSYTLGFKPKHQYSHAQLLAICSVFSELLRNKGTIKAVQLVGEVILRTEGILGTVACFMLFDETTNRELPTLRIIVPEKLAEIALFYDLLDYIVPAGCLIEIVRGEYIPPIEATTEVLATDEFVVLREIDGNSVAHNYRYKVPLNTMNPIQTNLDNFKQPKTELSRQHIANAFVWRRGNRRIEDRKDKTGGDSSNE